MQVYRNTVRFEIRPGVQPTFVRQDNTADGHQLALRADLEAFNFATVPRGEVLGWCKDEVLPLIARDASGSDLADEYLRLEGGVIRAARDFMPIMMSTRPDVALEDCLCYVVQEQSSGGLTARPTSP